jgi:anti-anti-sigma factor
MAELSVPETWNHPDKPSGAGILVHATGDEVVVSVAGELDLATAPTLLRCLESVARLPIEGLTIDLAELTFLDSSGLNALNQIRLLAAERKLPFALASIPPCAQRVLEITGMEAVFLCQ